MIIEDYVSFKTSQLLKEKGFNEECHQYYGDYKYPCPTLQMVMKWLREVHNLHCDIGYDFRLGWNNKITSLKETIIDHDIEMKTYLTNKSINYSSYEEACEDAIKYCIKELI